MIRIRISALTVTFAILLSAGSTVGQSGARGRRDADLPVYEWLREPDRQEIPVKLRVLGPLLTFEQRQQVRVMLIVDGRALQKKGAQRELHFLMKVADESGHWFSQENYGRATISEKLAGRAGLELVSDTYFQPGDYIRPPRRVPKGLHAAGRALLLSYFSRK